MLSFPLGVQNYKDFWLWINILQGNDWILSIGEVGSCQKVPKFDFQNFLCKLYQVFYHWRITFLILYPPLENLTTPINIVITKRTIINFLAGSYLLTFCIFCHMLLHIFCCKKRGSIWKQIIIDQNNLAIIRAHSKWCDDSLTPFGQIGL